MFNMDDGTKAIASLLFLQSATYAMDVYSAVMSSPWTTETASGGDPVKTAAARKYISHAVVQTSLWAVGAALIAGDQLWPFPLLGAGLEASYMFYLYYRALQIGANTGSRW